MIKKISDIFYSIKLINLFIQMIIFIQMIKSHLAKPVNNGIVIDNDGK